MNKGFENGRCPLCREEEGNVPILLKYLVPGGTVFEYKMPYY
jgi:hypothetical protein